MLKVRIIQIIIFDQIRIEHDDSGFNADWLCESVTIKTPSHTWVFPCKEWIGSKKANQLYRDCTPKQ